MDTIRLTWWNLENFFDTDDDFLSRDFDYTPAAGWTEPVFQAKKANLAAALNATHGGQGPELLGVAEVEKDELLEAVIAAMGKPHLKVVKDPAGTSDLRGIDVAMAYDERKLRVLSATSHLVHLRYRTRDLFEVVFEVLATGERLAVIGCHLPSRWMGRYRTEPLRIAVAEHIAYLVEDHVKLTPERYEALRAADDLGPVRVQWDARVLVVGDFNDEPCDRSLVDHLRASNNLERVLGETNDIDRFRSHADYRAKEVFLFNPTCKLLARQDTGTFFVDSLPTGERMTNRYQMLDQIVASRGLMRGRGLSLDSDSVTVFQDAVVATASGRPRGFSRRSLKGTSDHLPLTAVLRYGA